MILHLAKRALKPGIMVIEMKGSIHAGTDCRRLELEVENLVVAKTALVILDFTHIAHIDSSAIGSLVRSHTHVKKSGGLLRLAGIKGMLEGTLKLTKVDQLIEIFPSAPAAAENFVVPGGATPPGQV